jgi:hypothetical protein
VLGGPEGDQSVVVLDNDICAAVGITIDDGCRGDASLVQYRYLMMHMYHSLLLMLMLLASLMALVLLKVVQQITLIRNDLNDCISVRVNKLHDSIIVIPLVALTIAASPPLLLLLLTTVAVQVENIGHCHW